MFKLETTQNYIKALRHGANCKNCREIWQQSKASFKDKFGDIHTRLMRKNYEAVPQWWFHSLLLLVAALSLFACEGFDRQLQLPYWGVVLAIALAFVFTLPVGVIAAITNQVPKYFINLIYSPFLQCSYTLNNIFVCM